MKQIPEVLHGYAIESGEIKPVTDNEQLLDDLLLDETIAANEPTVAETIADAETSEDIAEQLDGIAERSDELVEKQEDPETAVSEDVLEVSVESLHREFISVMRANKLQTLFKATSFESAQRTSKDRLLGLSNDARRVSKISRGHALQLKNLSTEDSDIGRFLRQDSSRLRKAQAVLGAAVGKLNNELADLKDTPKIIDHEGIGRWMTVENQPIISLKAAVQTESAWLSKAHDAVEKTVSDLKAAAKKLEADPSLSVDELLPASMFAAINSLNTATGALMGNITIAGVGDGKKVNKYTRQNEFKFSKGSAVKALGWAVLANIGWGLATGAAIYIGGAVTGGAIAKAANSVVGSEVLKFGNRMASTVSGIKSYEKDVNKSTAQSVANPSDLKDALTIILGYEKYTSFRVESDFGFFQRLMEDKKDPDLQQSKAARKAIGDAIGRCAELAEIIYDQAIYSTTNAAVLATKAA